MSKNEEKILNYEDPEMFHLKIIAKIVNIKYMVKYVS